MKKDNYGQMERLLDMMEHPDQYTDEQLNELLRDDELRQTYQLISDTTSAYEYRRTSDKLTDEIIEGGMAQVDGKEIYLQTCTPLLQTDCCSGHRYSHCIGNCRSCG